MKLRSQLVFRILVQQAYGQVVLNADGAGDTYELITSIFAPDYNPTAIKFPNR